MNNPDYSKFGEKESVQSKEKMMNNPKVKMIAVSNIFCRMMHFEKSGDVEVGHFHNYDHGTLVSSGEVFVEILDDNDNTLASRVFTAPGLIFIAKDKRHRLTATKDDTVVACLHAIRDSDGNILSPDFLIEEKWFANNWSESENINDHFHVWTQAKHNLVTKKFTV